MIVSDAGRRRAAEEAWRALRPVLADEALAALGADGADAFLTRVEVSLVDIHEPLAVLYGADADAFDALDDALVAVFCGQASVALANARVYDRALAVNQQLSTALETRVVIEQAKGVLMGRHGWSSDEAFLELRRRSQTTNRKLRDVAAEVVSAVPRQRR